MADILSHVTRVLAGRGNHPRLALGPVSEKNAERVREQTGMDIAGYTRVLESSDVRHSVASHGNAMREKARGQVAISKQDFGNIPAIVEHAHSVELKGAPNSAKLQRLVYHAHIDGFVYEYVETIRPRGQTSH